MMKIVEGEDLINHIFEYDVILVGTSTMNALGNGFQRKIAINFPEVSKQNKETNYGDPRKLGKTVLIEGKPTFVLCYINKGRRRPDLNPDYLDYEALKECLNSIRLNFPGLKIASTIMGQSIYEGNGNRTEILSLFEKISDMDITLYDYEQQDWRGEEQKEWKTVAGASGTNDYQKLKKEFLWKNAFGELTPKISGFDEMSDKEIKKYIKEKKAER